jgi:hypothetical protein
MGDVFFFFFNCSLLFTETISTGHLYRTQGSIQPIDPHQDDLATNVSTINPYAAPKGQITKTALANFHQNRGWPGTSIWQEGWQGDI